MIDLSTDPALTEQQHPFELHDLSSPQMLGVLTSNLSPYRILLHAKIELCSRFCRLPPPNTPAYSSVRGQGLRFFLFPSRLPICFLFLAPTPNQQSIQHCCRRLSRRSPPSFSSAISFFAPRIPSLLSVPYHSFGFLLNFCLLLLTYYLLNFFSYPSRSKPPQV